jgi:hypothetical protein
MLSQTQVSLHVGHAVGQGVSHQSLTMEALVLAWGSLFEVCGGQGGTATVFSPSSVFSWYHFTMAPTHMSSGE